MYPVFAIPSMLKCTPVLAECICCLLCQLFHTQNNFSDSSSTQDVFYVDLLCSQYLVRCIIRCLYLDCSCDYMNFTTFVFWTISHRQCCTLKSTLVTLYIYIYLDCSFDSFASIINTSQIPKFSFLILDLFLSFIFTI